jgi:hypothetical protein
VIAPSSRRVSRKDDEEDGADGMSWCVPYHGPPPHGQDSFHCQRLGIQFQQNLNGACRGSLDSHERDHFLSWKSNNSKFYCLVFSWNT